MERRYLSPMHSPTIISDVLVRPCSNRFVQVSTVQRKFSHPGVALYTVPQSASGVAAPNKVGLRLLGQRCLKHHCGLV